MAKASKRGKGSPFRGKRSKATSPRKGERSTPRDSGRVARARLIVNPGGFAFAERLDEEGSIFVPPGNLGGAMDGDEVMVSWWPAGRGPEGHVRSVVARGRTRVSGVLRRAGKHLVLEPDDPRLLVDHAEVVGGADRSAVNQLVVGTIIDYPDAWEEHFSVRVDRVLGKPGTLPAEEERILVENGIVDEFPEDVLAEAEEVPDRVHPADHENRADLRKLDFMTIDPPDARDFDDAVCVEVLGKDMKTANMRVHVAVADVSHYVRVGTAVDREAAQRSFSTYLPDRAIPMLPEQLSSGICSLVPRKDRCAMVVTFDLDRKGRVGEAEVRAAVIHSKKRLTYDQVAAEMDGKKRLPPVIRKRIAVLRTAADRLKAARGRRGSIELDLPEKKIVLDEDDRSRIRKIYSARASRSVARAYNLIEEFMVAANEGVGRLAVKHKLPAVFRVHDKPDEERLERFSGVSDFFGLPVDPESLLRPKGVRKYLQRASKTTRSQALSGQLLRSMAQAEYSTMNVGHFALASTAYSHFTSPIRRYPDLVTHRVMKAFLASRGGACGPEPVPKLPRLKESQEHATWASSRERASADAENQCKDLFAAAFMRDRIGDRFEGTITGMVPSGIFITLDEPFVDGMVRRTLIEKDHRETYEMDELGVSMVAPRSGHALTVGDRVIVEVVDASLARRQIDLALISKLSASS